MDPAMCPGLAKYGKVGGKDSKQAVKESTWSSINLYYGLRGGGVIIDVFVNTCGEIYSGNITPLYTMCPYSFINHEFNSKINKFLEFVFVVTIQWCV